MKEKIEEYANLNKDLGNHATLALPFAFFFAGLLMFISFLFGIREHRWSTSIMACLGLYIFIIKLKERKKMKARLKELKVELKLE